VRTLIEAVEAILDRRLASRTDAPFAVAFSGGGDSLALLILALEWAGRHDRRVLALVLDHGLNPDSSAWTRFAAEAAARLGAQVQTLSWDGPKPETGLPAAARAARHAVLAQAARASGASVLLMGHTADDRLEAEHMRAEGSSVPDPKTWAPSPAWPQGRGVSVLRPLINIRRDALRDFLRARGERWLDDPTNDDPRFARARARVALADQEPAPAPADVAEPVAIEGWRESFGALEAEGEVGPAALAAACLCAAGTTRPPAATQIARVMALMERGEGFAATLAGARVARRGGRLSITRETGRLPIESLAIAEGETLVWDGRFELKAAGPNLTVRVLGGLASHLPKSQREALSEVPIAARPSLPVLISPDGEVSCPVLAGGSPGATAVSLVMARFAAACGQVDFEPS